jgi:hypothetical protein
MALGATHHNVFPHVRKAAQEVQSRFGGYWNTYVRHGALSGHDERQVIDHWGSPARGVPLPEAQGDAMVAWILGQHQIRPVVLLIWYGWWWRPRRGWEPYPGWGGPHGPGVDSHIHVVYE